MKPHSDLLLRRALRGCSGNGAGAKLARLALFLAIVAATGATHRLFAGGGLA